MLVVITIVGILASLITAAAWRAVVTARNAAIKMEITQLDMALKAFKEALGDYPPDFSDSAALQRFLRRAFPNATSYPDFSDTTKYNPATALAFWLGGPAGNGFSADSYTPFTPASGSRIGPFFDFDRNRLNTTDPLYYYPPNVNKNTSAPYVYYRANSNGTYGPYTAWDPGWTRPNPYMQNSQPINPQSFQILCAGRDGVYGTGVDYPKGTDYTPAQYDDLSNFTDGTMEQAMP